MLPNISRSSRRFLNSSFSTFKNVSHRSFSSSRPSHASRLLVGTTLLGGIGAAYIGSQWVDPTVGKPIKLDSPVSSSIVQSDTKVQFPTHVNINNTEYGLLGTGVRSVTFFFHVYALGVYIAKDDLPKAKQILISSTSSDNQIELEKALLDSEKGAEIISKLLAAGTRLTIRIIPVRNTDFGHLRDGFVRAVIGHPRFKQLSSGDESGEGIGELKRAFGRKRSVQKGQILYLNRSPEGKLSIEYYQSKHESEDKREILGVVQDPLISELLFLKYLSGKNPSSEGARKESIEGLVKMIS